MEGPAFQNFEKEKIVNPFAQLSHQQGKAPFITEKLPNVKSL